MKKNNKKGFTLVELVIVVAVMAVLVAVAIPTIGTITNSAKNAVDDSNARTIESVIKLAEANASKVATTDGVATLTGAEIQTAINNAKLGITGTRNDAGAVTTKDFYYNSATGVVNTTASNAEGVYKLAFSADGVVTVTPDD